MRQRTTLALIVTVGLGLTAAPAKPPSRQADKAKPAAAGAPGRIVADWRLQDDAGPKGYPKAIAGVLGELGDTEAVLRREFDRLRRGKVSAGDARWPALYVKACERRRAARLGPYLEQIRRVAFTRHHDLGGSHYAYTEALSDGQGECHWLPGAALCVLKMDGIYARIETLLEDPAGMIRDPDVSRDGRRILFAWKKSKTEDDFHLYEMTVADRKVRRLTGGLGHADYEGAYLPGGDIVFNSTRCVQTVDCWHPTVSNLFTCDKDGRFMRRLGFDQVHTNYPTVTPDGRVIYTRWEYSDRGQVYPQGLFQMYPDGTGQTELYGNNSWFPTTILHARAIPGTQKIVAVFSGHHARQRGKLGIIDPGRGRQENQGARLIAPVRRTDAVRVDQYGQNGEQFQYPYPLDETAFLVTYKPDKSQHPFAIYFMRLDGRRELLAWDEKISCNQPVPLVARPRTAVRDTAVDYRARTGTYYLQDIYAGPGLAGIPRGTIRGLRVVAITYRPVDIGRNVNEGPAGRAMVSTPVAIGGGTWDPKVVLGTAKVHADGSACFTVPARTPVYFQALDARNHAVQSMRSWSTLQPGETFACVGCHEDKNTAPPAGRISLAMRAGPQKLTDFYGPPRGFSFQREIQPILDKHCTRCHDGRGAVPAVRPSASFAHAGDAAEALCDGKTPKDSADHSIPRFTWWAHKGTSEWVRYDLAKPTRVTGVEVYWFDDEARKGRCRVPKAWNLQYKDGEKWRAVNTAGKYGVKINTFNKLRFRPIETTALRLKVKLQKNYSGGILEWRLVPPLTVSSKRPENRAPFSLLARTTTDAAAKRNFSDAYLALTNADHDRKRGSLSGRQNERVNWINAQSAPPMLAPYTAGAAKSGLITMLRAGHNKVMLSPEELDKIACWIDLLVPYCADYAEAGAWSAKELETYEYFMAKRKKWQQQEAANIAEMLRSQPPR